MYIVSQKKIQKYHTKVLQKLKAYSILKMWFRNYLKGAHLY